MKTLKMICMVAVLISAISLPGSAGEINSPGYTGDPAPPISQPSPKPEDESLVIMSSGQTSDVTGTELMAILLALSALF